MRARLPLLLLLTVWFAACGPTVDLSQGLQVLDVKTGWFDAGIVEGKNKLVPMISFKLKNVSDQTLGTLQVNAVFRRVNETVEWSATFLTVTGSDGLPPGATTDTLTVKATLGYTGSDQTRAEMLQNSQFLDAKVEVFAKYASVQWKKVGEYVMARDLILP